jgi:hypothetical protein
MLIVACLILIGTIVIAIHGAKAQKRKQDRLEMMIAMKVLEDWEKMHPESVWRWER